MKLSWSHKLFLKINRQVGKHAWLDKTMYFCAHWLIWLMILAIILWSYPMWTHNKQFGAFLVGVTYLVFSAVFAYAVSFVTAYIWRHERPIREMKHIRVLLDPLGDWKSFPSDHTIAVTLITWFGWTFIWNGGGGWLFQSVESTLLLCVFLTLAALFVMFGRVYVGVHYPRDILGGIVVGSVVWYILVLL